jgi:membrane-bound serine protease (ClpP class)
MTAAKCRNQVFLAGVLLFAFSSVQGAPDGPPRVVILTLDQMVNHVTAEYIVDGIKRANDSGAEAVLLEMDTPGGMSNSMRDIIKAIYDSRVPVITYVAPSGSSAASAGFFILLAGDVAAMAPGTNSGAAHPVVLFNTDVGKTMEEKIENDSASYIRSISEKRGRNVQLAEAGVRESKSYTEKESLDGKLIDLVAASPQELLAKLDGRTVRRINDTTVTLHLAGARLEPHTMTRRDRVLAWVADPNIAFFLGAGGVACLYLEFTHPGLVAPGVVGAIALVLALYSFNLLPLNMLGVMLIVLALVLFVLEVKFTSYGLLGAAGVVAMTLGAMILVDSPLPEGRIRMTTALGVTVPLAVIMIVLLRLAMAARNRKVVTGEEAMVGLLGVAQSDLNPSGQVLIRGEIWRARSSAAIPSGTRVRVLKVEGLTLIVEPAGESR